MSFLKFLRDMLAIKGASDIFKSITKDHTHTSDDFHSFNTYNDIDDDLDDYNDDYNDDYDDDF